MKRNQDKNDEGMFETTVFRAVQSLGWLLPQTEREVASIEVAEEQVDLPTALCDPMAALDRPRKPVHSMRTADCDQKIVEDLARVARQGNAEISNEVAEQMRLDRDVAECEASLRGDQ